jgi:RHS repeat-associated protein
VFTIPEPAFTISGIRKYDAGERLVAATYRTTDASPSILERYRYAYDPSDNRIGEQVGNVALGATADNMNRLLSRQPGGTLAFAGLTSEPSWVTVQGRSSPTTADNVFRAAAQVATGMSAVLVVAVDPSGNSRANTYELSASGSTTPYTYDANGNLVADGDRTYEWDAEDRLVRVSHGTTELARFVYDGFGRRVQKIAGAAARSYIYDDDDIIQERLEGGGTTTFFHGPGIDQPLAKQDAAGAVSYYVADRLGSVVQATDSGAAVILSRRYDPYGQLLSGAATPGYAFTGREWDAETDLYYYRARYYDAKSGRFISEDPLGLEGGVNPYWYADAQPNNLVDPHGELAQAVAAGLDLGYQLFRNGFRFRCVNWKEVALSMIGGGLVRWAKKAWNLFKGSKKLLKGGTSVRTLQRRFPKKVRPLSGNDTIHHCFILSGDIRRHPSLARLGNTALFNLKVIPRSLNSSIGNDRMRAAWACRDRLAPAVAAAGDLVPKGCDCR